MFGIPSLDTTMKRIDNLTPCVRYIPDAATGIKGEWQSIANNGPRAIEWRIGVSMPVEFIIHSPVYHL